MSLVPAVTVPVVIILVVVVSVASALYIWFVSGVDCYHKYLCFVLDAQILTSCC